MRFVLLLTAAVALSFSQTYGEETFTGFLVADGCHTARISAVPQETPKTAKDMNTDRARDVAQNTGGADSQLERTRDMDQTRGSADRAGLPSAEKLGEVMSTTSWDKGCFIRGKTSSFKLETGDGRTLNFDEEGNRQVKAEIGERSKTVTKEKIFRARVAGTVEGHTLHVTKIVM